MLSRKNYEEIANCIAVSRIIRESDVCFIEYELGINAGCQDVIYRLIDYFEQDNPNFDQLRFLDACFRD